MEQRVEEQIQGELKFQFETSVAGCFAVVEHMLEELNVHTNGQIAGHQQTQLAERISKEQIQFVVLVVVGQNGDDCRRERFVLGLQVHQVNFAQKSEN